ncbi:MAG: Hsp20/alpha crystallin family protein [Paracoccaceae bacterium]
MLDKPFSTGWMPDLYEPFRSVTSKIADWFAPAAEASDSRQAYEVALELPGVAEKDIEVSLHDGVLTGKGEKRSEQEEKGRSFYFSERSYGAFQRSFRLPADAREDTVMAEMEDGVLKISIEKETPRVSETKRISIKRK